MSTSRLLLRILIVVLAAFAGAGAGVYVQVMRITSKPQRFLSLAKLVAGASLTPQTAAKEQLDDFYGTVLETLESTDMKRRALERVRALHPDLGEVDVQIRVSRTQGSGIFNVLAEGDEPKYTRVFLDALLDEYLAFRQSTREMAQGKGLQDFLQSVVDAQKHMENSLEVMEKARSKAESPSAKAEYERLAARLASLRNQRDDLRLELKTTTEPSRALLEAKLGALEQEIQTVETAVNLHETAMTESRIAAEKFANAKATWEKMFARVQEYQASFETAGDHIAIQERATPAAEHVEDWKMPLAIGAVGGGLLGTLFGFLLSLVILRTPPPTPPSMPPPLA